jgi:hypothetical protein
MLKHQNPSRAPSLGYVSSRGQIGRMRGRLQMPVPVCATAGQVLSTIASPESSTHSSPMSQRMWSFALRNGQAMKRLFGRCSKKRGAV